MEAYFALGLVAGCWLASLAGTGYLLCELVYQLMQYITAYVEYSKRHTANAD